MPKAKHHNAARAARLFIDADKYEEKRNFRAAFECYLSAAKLGDTGCQVNLGNYYSWGRGTRKSLEKAAYWYKKAYRGGEASGAHNLAIDRRNQGDLRSAIFWFKKAVAMDDGDAHIELAKIYAPNRGGRKKAIELLRRTLRLRRVNISQAGREEADSLLQEILVS